MDKIPVSLNQGVRLAQQFPLAGIAAMPATGGLVTFNLRSDEHHDREQLRHALASVVSAHGALRSRFHRNADGHWEVDLLGDGIADFTGDTAQKPFDIGGGRWLRVSHCDTQDGTKLTISTDHLVFDGLSIGVFVDDMNRVLRDPSTVLPDDGYAAWIEREHSMLIGPEGVQARAFWLDKLRATGVFPKLPFQPGPTEGPMTAALFTENEWRLIRRAIHKHGTTTSACIALLGRVIEVGYGPNPVVVQLVFANRGSELTANTIGWLANGLAIRIDTATQPGLPGIRQVFTEMMTAVEHGRMPMHAVVPELDPVDGIRRPRIFFALEERSAAGPVTAPFTIVPDDEAYPVFGALAVRFTADSSGLSVTVDADSAVAGRQEISTLIKLFQSEAAVFLSHLVSAS